MGSESYQISLSKDIITIYRALYQAQHVQIYKMQVRSVKNGLFCSPQNIFIHFHQTIGTSSTDQRTPLHEHKITSESPHVHTVMEKVESTRRLS